MSKEYQPIKQGGYYLAQPCDFEDSHNIQHISNLDDAKKRAREFSDAVGDTIIIAKAIGFVEPE